MWFLELETQIAIGIIQKNTILQIRKHIKLYLSMPPKPWEQNSSEISPISLPSSIINPISTALDPTTPDTNPANNVYGSQNTGYGSGMYGGSSYGSGMYGNSYGSGMYGNSYGSGMYGNSYGSGMYGMNGMNGMNSDPNNPGLMDKGMQFLNYFGFLTNSLCEVARYLYFICLCF